MKKIVTIFFVAWYISCFSQNKIAPTATISITGAVINKQEIDIAAIRQIPSRNIGKVTITNHSGEKRGMIKKLRGVPIIELLKSIQIDNNNPKQLSEYYLVFQASDGYKVVYSWNELFNTSTGSNTFIVTEKEGTPLENMAESIMVITPKDIQTGRRYIKCMKQITVVRAGE